MLLQGAPSQRVKATSAQSVGGLMRSAGQSGCSPSHAGLDPKVRKKWRDTYKKNTGYSHNSQNPEVQRKRKDNYKAKTGYSHWSSNPEVQAKKESTNLRNRGVRFPTQSKNVIAKSKATMIAKYGVDNNWARESVRATARENCLERYGVPYHCLVKHVQDKAHSKDSREKIAATNIKRYGVRSTLSDEGTRQKIRASHMARRGVPYPTMDPQVIRKIRRTCLKIYGYRYPMQNVEVFNRSRSRSHRRKIWVDAVGRTHILQGYEPQVFEYLQTQGVTHVNTGTKVPSVHYGKRTYHPDGVVRAPNGRSFVIEVKGRYTLENNLENNLKKFRAANRQFAGTPLSLILAILGKDSEVTLIHKPNAAKVREWLDSN